MTETEHGENQAQELTPSGSAPEPGNGQETPAHVTRLRKGMYIVPSLITSAAFFCGFYTIIASINGQYYQAAWAILFAMFFDGMDGRVARATGATTNFGLELDSLSDLLAFGAAPAILMYNWVLQPFGKLGWMAAFLFALCGALRLARFNTQTAEVRKDRFVGLPIPPAAGLLATVVLLTRGALEVDKAPAVMILITMYALALLMVSSIPYRNFKNLELRKKRPFHILIAIILFFFVVAMFPHFLLFGMAVVYAAHGPVEWLRDPDETEIGRIARSFFGQDKPQP